MKFFHLLIEYINNKLKQIFMKKVILSMLALVALTIASCKHNETEGNAEAVAADSTAVVVDSTAVEVKVDSTKADTTKVVEPVKEIK